MTLLHLCSLKNNFSIDVMLCASKNALLQQRTLFAAFILTLGLKLKVYLIKFININFEPKVKM